MDMGRGLAVLPMRDLDMAVIWGQTTPPQRRRHCGRRPSLTISNEWSRGYRSGGGEGVRRDGRRSSSAVQEKTTQDGGENEAAERNLWDAKRLCDGIWHEDSKSKARSLAKSGSVGGEFGARRGSWRRNSRSNVVVHPARRLSIDPLA